ncbi:MAG: hypothetical protein ACP5NO_03565 [Thermoplasmata archaeon]
MENEIIQVQDIEKLQKESPFLIFVPDDLEIKNVTYRTEGRKWATMRYECIINGEKLRVKEFFLDWFYPGFPKSLMESFVSSYSIVESIYLKDWVVFTGKNYKGKEASSSFSLGTQIEIEGESKRNVRDLSETMLAPFPDERFKNFPFYRRSFFANKGEPDWFEEKRIKNLKWKAPSIEFCADNLCMDSVGVFKEKDSAVETVFTFSEDYYRRAAWVDIAVPKERPEHLVYDLRGNGNFFDEFEPGEPTVAFRRENGPAIFRLKLGRTVITITLSPLFTLSEAKSKMKKLMDTVKEQERFI